MKITKFLREYMFGFIIITIVAGVLLLFMGVLWFWFRDLELGFYTDAVRQLENWNAYVLVGGVIIFLIGLYYLYVFQKDKRFVLTELKTNKRSELIKKHRELRKVVKHLPSKYQRMLRDKEKELKIK